MKNQITTKTSEKFGNLRTIQQEDKVLFCASDVAKALGYANPNKAINDHCRAITKRATPISGKMQAINYIPEGDVYRLICHSKLPTAMDFEKWVFDDVVPSVVKNGKYETKPKVEQLTLETKEYHYYDKSFEGNPVLSAADFEHFTGISEYRVRYYLEKFCEKHVDYYLLEGPFLYKYKLQNPNVSKLASAIFVISKRGFIKAVEYFGCKNSTPNQLLEKFSLTENTRVSPCVTEEEYIIALNVLQKVKKQEERCKNKYESIGQLSMASGYDKDIEAIKVSMKSIAMMLLTVK